MNTIYYLNYLPIILMGFTTLIISLSVCLGFYIFREKLIKVHFLKIYINSWKLDKENYNDKKSIKRQKRRNKIIYIKRFILVMIFAVQVYVLYFNFMDYVSIKNNNLNPQVLNIKKVEHIKANNKEYTKITLSFFIESENSEEIIKTYNLNKKIDLKEGENYSITFLHNTENILKIAK